MTDVQKLVQHTIDERVETGAEAGVQVAVYRNGELIVDAAAGLADPDTGRPIDSATPVYAWSMGKAMTPPSSTAWSSAACSGTTRRSWICGRVRGARQATGDRPARAQSQRRGARDRHGYDGRGGL